MYSGKDFAESQKIKTMGQGIAQCHLVKKSASILCHSEERSDEESAHFDRAKILRLRSG